MKHIPNLLSFFRIFLIPVFVYLMYVGRTAAAALILAVSGLTDMLDGFLARRFNWVTQLGKVLDPAADKLTQVVVCTVLAVTLREYWPFFAVMLIKELIMLITSGYLIKNQVRLDGSRWFGKLGTALFYSTITLIVFAPGMPANAIISLLTATTSCSLGAALMYIPEFFKYRRNIPGTHAKER